MWVLNLKSQATHVTAQCRCYLIWIIWFELDIRHGLFRPGFCLTNIIGMCELIYARVRREERRTWLAAHWDKPWIILTIKMCWLNIPERSIWYLWTIYSNLEIGVRVADVIVLRNNFKLCLLDFDFQGLIFMAFQSTDRNVYAQPRQTRSNMSSFKVWWNSGETDTGEAHGTPANICRRDRPASEAV